MTQRAVLASAAARSRAFTVSTPSSSSAALRSGVASAGPKMLGRAARGGSQHRPIMSDQAVPGVSCDASLLGEPFVKTWLRKVGGIWGVKSRFRRGPRGRCRSLELDASALGGPGEAQIRLVGWTYVSVQGVAASPGEALRLRVLGGPVSGDPDPTLTQSGGVRRRHSAPSLRHGVLRHA